MEFHVGRPRDHALEPILGALLLRKALHMTTRVDLTKEPTVEVNLSPGNNDNVRVPRRKFGVVIVGNSYDTEERDILLKCGSTAVRTLRKTGYFADNIYLLDGDGVRNRGVNTVPSSREGVRETFDDLSRKMTPDDAFFVYYVGHGIRSRIIPQLGQAKVLLADSSRLRGRQLRGMLDDIDSQYGVCFIQSCFSGRMAQRLGKDNRIAIATSHPRKIFTGDETLAKNFFERASTPRVSVLDASRHAAKLDDEMFKGHTRYGVFPVNNTMWLQYDRVHPRDVML